MDECISYSGFFVSEENLLWGVGDDILTVDKCKKRMFVKRCCKTFSLAME